MVLVLHPCVVAGLQVALVESVGHALVGGTPFKQFRYRFDPVSEFDVVVVAAVVGGDGIPRLCGVDSGKATGEPAVDERIPRLCGVDSRSERKP